MEFRYAVRMLAKTPAFTLVAVLTLALGIGLNTVVFTIYESVALKPLAVRTPDEMVRVIGRYEGPTIEAFSYLQYEQLRDHVRSFASVVATSTPQSVLCTLPGSQPGDSQVVNTRLVSSNYFEALGVNLEIGRGFGMNESAVAVISHAFWEQSLHKDASVLGKELGLQGSRFSIIGVAPDYVRWDRIAATQPGYLDSSHG